MVGKLVAMYERGALLADDLAWRCVCLIDPADASPVLDALPETILVRMRRLLDDFRPGRMLSNRGPTASAEQVEAARRWMEASSKVEPAESSKV